MRRQDSYTMDDQMKIAVQAANDIENYLNGLPYTISVVNVEGDRAYQKKDIDLLWKYQKNGKIIEKKIEIKGDTYYKTGNIFVEMISNMSKNTPGCFMYTEADYIYYYFIDTRELNVIHMENFREWWKDEEKNYKPVYLKTKVRKNEDIYYSSMGKLVKKKTLWDVLGTKHFILPESVRMKIGA